MERRQRVRWHHHPWISSALAWLAASYIRLIERTGRWQVQYTPATEGLIRSGEPFICAFWHGRLIMSFPAWQALLAKLSVSEHPDLYVMISTHGDGQLIHQVAHKFGAKTLWGSSRRGGLRALLQAQKALEDGNIVAITPDGPRGPCMRSQPGAAYLSTKTRVPVVPMTFATKRQRVLKSWDRFMLVLPFARGMIAFGDPIEPAGDSDIESLRALIEERMINLSKEIDQVQGIMPVQPAT